MKGTAVTTYFVFTDEAGVYQQHPNEKTIRNSPFYIRSNVIMTAEAYKTFQSDTQELNKKNTEFPLEKKSNGRIFGHYIKIIQEPIL